MTDLEYRKALKDHASALWSLYLSTLPINPTVAEQIKAQAGTAFDLHYEFCRIGTRHELDKIRAQREELAHVQVMINRRF